MKEFLQNIAKRQKCNTIEDLYASIGYGGTQIWRIIPRIKDEYLKIYRPEPNDDINTVEKKEKKTVSSGVVINGIDNCLIKFSRCCNPLPGDDIIGFITRGYGVSIHKKTCSNVPKDITKSAEPERWVEAYWTGSVKEEFKSTLEIVASDRTGLLADVTLQLSAMHIFIQSLNSRPMNNDQAVVYATITINGIDHLKSVISRLSKIKGIISIKRS